MDEIIYNPMEVENPKASMEQTEVIGDIEVEDAKEAEVEIDDTDVEQIETVDYVEVEDIEPVVIEVDDAFSAYEGSDIIKHEHLKDRDAPSQHPIVAIDGLEEVLTKLGKTKTVYAKSGGFAELRPWNPDGKTQGVGYFVSLIRRENDGNNYIDIYNSNADVYGVTVSANEVGFYGYQNENYNEIDEPANRLGDPAYAKVCLLGNVRVRISEEDFNKVEVGDYIVPNNFGYASVYPEKGTEKYKAGYKVTSRGSIQDADEKTVWWYVGISLVPQNDNMGRIVEELKNAQGKLENVTIQLGGVQDSLINVSGKIEGFDKIIEEGKVQIEANLTDISKEALQKAEEIANQADETIKKVQQEYAEAVNRSNRALNIVEDALENISALQDTMTPLATWVARYECVLQQDISMNTWCYFELDGKKYKFIMPTDVVVNDKIQYDVTEKLIIVKDNKSQVEEIKDSTGLVLIEPFKSIGNQKVAGFVTQANSDHVQLSTMVQAMSDKGTNMAAIIQQADDNGASIQHLVTHIDKYVLGKVSPINGLSLDKVGFIQPGIIYVPTETHTETYQYTKEESEDTIEFTFELGQSYEWKEFDGKQKSYEWSFNGAVYLLPPESPSTNDLWYCADGVLEDDKYIYNPGTLYRWEGMWTAVASVNDKTSRAISLINQTAEDLTLTCTNLEDSMSALTITVNEISSQVKNLGTGALSEIEQTAEKILMGVYNSEEDNNGATSLEVLLDGVTNTSVKTGDMMIKHVLQPNTKAPENKYSQRPTWNGTKFIFTGEPTTEGSYYFDSDVHTYYCEDVDGGYKYWGIDKTAMTSLKTRVSDVESEINSLTQFKTDMNKTVTSITQTSDADTAEIASVVFGEYRKRVEINIELTEEVRDALGELQRYISEPKYDDKKFTFNGVNKDDNGVYCAPSDENYDGSYYYKLLLNDEKIVGYEKYEMYAPYNYSSIVQKVDDDKSYIGLVAGNDEDMGSVVVRTINDRSEIFIGADKIGINGVTTFASLFDEGTTTINGSCIRSGIIASNNYDGSATYVRYGLKIQDNQIVNGDDTDCIYFTTMLKDTKYQGINIESNNKIEVEIEDEEIEEENVPIGSNIFIFNEELGIITGLSDDGQNLTEVTIPSQINGVDVVEIGDNVFYNNIILTSIIIPNSVQTIGNYAFSDCYNLKSVACGSSVMTIGSYAFADCHSLTSITIPASVQTIGEYAFGYCKSLKNINVDEANSAYLSSDGILFDKSQTILIQYPCRKSEETYVIPDSVTEIGYGAFYKCENLIGITVPKSVITIQDEGFYGCNNLTDIYYKGTEAQWSEIVVNSCNQRLMNVTLRFRPTGDDLIAEGYVDGLQDCKWTLDTTDTLIISGEGIKDLEVNIKQHWRDDNYINKIKKIVIEDGLKQIGKYAFDGCCNVRSVIIPNSVTSIREYAFRDCENLDNVIIPNGITNISRRVFADCTGLTNVTIPKSVRSIDQYAFYNCTNLTYVYYQGTEAEWGDITISDGNDYLTSEKIQYITNSDTPENSCGENVFWTLDENNVLTISGIGDMTSYSGANTIPWHNNRSIITDVVIEDGVTSISAYAFYNCTKLINVTISDSVATIGKYAFYKCYKLQNVYISDIAEWCNIVFSHMESNPFTYAEQLYLNKKLITNLAIPNSVVSINEFAFDGYRQLTNLLIPNSITSIGEYAFRNCSNLKKVYITDLETWCNIDFDDVTSNPLNYANMLYLNGNLITNIVIPDEVTTIKNFAFVNCLSLMKVIIPDNVTLISSSAFYGCSNLMTITIGSNITSIDDRAFCNCSQLTSVIVPNSVTRIGHFIFQNCESLERITLGNNIQTIGSYAFQNCSKLTTITIPENVENIGTGIFDGCSIEVVYVTNSVAFQYVQDNNINYACILYRCNTITADEKLIGYLHTKGTAENSMYIVSSRYFELIPELNTTKGMMLNLNEGTIASKNFNLDAKGNVSIAGKIAATSGYIGNEECGLNIGYTPTGVCYTVGEEGLPAGNYCLKYITQSIVDFSDMGHKYTAYGYSKITLFEDLKAGDILCFEPDMGDYYVNSVKLCTVNERIEGAINEDNQIIYTDENQNEVSSSDIDTFIEGRELIEAEENTAYGYHLHIGQNSLKGRDDRLNGVYIGTDGIGLGNGWFQVNNYGKMSFSKIATINPIFWQDVVEDEEGNSEYASIGGSGIWTSLTSEWSARHIAWSAYNPYGFENDDGSWSGQYEAGLLYDKGSGYNWSKKSYSNHKLHCFAPMVLYSGSTDLSDSRLKTNIIDVDFNATDLLNQIELKSFDWIETGKHENIGIIAQQLEKVLPNLVVTDAETGLKSVSYMGLISYLVKAVQELSAIVNPPIALLSLDDEVSTTHWVDDMTEEDKQKYVKIEQALKYVKA